MAILAGTWGTPTIEGPRALEVDGVTFNIPQDAEVRVVNAGKIDVAHIKHDGRVVVLSARGQLVESDDEATARASIENWRAVSGS